MPIEGPPDLTEPLPQPVGKVANTNTAREIMVPFTFDRGGGVQVTTDPDVQIRQHVEALLRTIPGERVMKPTFGVSLLQYVFENISPAELAAMQQLISDGFDNWLPSARLVSLDAINGPDNGVPRSTVIVDLQYARRYDANPTVVSASIPVVSI